MNILLRAFGKIPLIGHLTTTNKTDHLKAITELIPNFIISSLPFWLGSLIIYATTNIPDKAYLPTLFGTMNQGELFIYCTSLLAPFFYLALYDPAGSRAFPSRLSHAILILVIVIICTAMFSLQRAGVWLDFHFVFRASIGLTLLSLFLIYLAMVYHSARLRDPAEVMRETQDEFVKALAKHRG